MRRVLAGLTATSVVVLCLTNVATASAPRGPSSSRPRCNPVTAAPHFRHTVPTPHDVLGYRVGSREATNQQIGRYWRAADRASARVRTGVYAHSWEGRPLRYALVGTPSNLHRLPTIRRNLDRLRDPSTPDAQARALMRRTPTILWIAANVHGNEPSGADAVLRLLYELADRSDCVAAAILGHAVVGLIPVQNPDGRAHDTRYNSYAFDMNRDGLVGTQPEISGRLGCSGSTRRSCSSTSTRTVAAATSSHRTPTRSTTRPRTGCTSRSRTSTARRTRGRSRRTAGATRPGGPGTTSSPRCTATPSRPPRWARWG